MVEHLNKTVNCTLKPSPIHGVGVFAIRDIPQGTCIAEESPEIECVILSEDEFSRLMPEVQHEVLEHTVFIEGEPIAFISPNSACNFRSYLNHSDEPNTDGRYALRDIKKGEELTEDFKTMGPVHPMTKQHMKFVWN